MPYQPPSHIAILNKSSFGDGQAALWVEAYRAEIGRVAAAWQLDPPGLALYPRGHTEEPDPAVAAIYIVDSAGDPNALGYHNAIGRSRFGYVDMELSAAAGLADVVFGHELWELFVNADLDRWMGPYPDGAHVPVEIADPSELDFYTVRAELLGASADVRISNYVLPAWFQPGAPGPYDYLSRVPRPLEDAPGGYHLVERNGVLVTGPARVKSFGRTFRLLVGGRAR